MSIPRPSYLTNCNPRTRLFPLDWKVAYYRLHAGADAGYTCPGCMRVFCGPDDFELLHADHKLAWIHGGQTVWENLELLCGTCNLTKSDKQIRSQ